MFKARGASYESGGDRQGVRMGMCAARLMLCAAVMLAASAAVAHAQVVPKRVEIVYRVSIGPLKIGEGHDLLEHDGKTYTISSEAKTTGVAAVLYRLSIVRESRGRVTPKGLVAESYTEVRNGKPKRSASFDWEKKQAFLIDGEHRQTVDLPENTWDHTSLGYNFAFAGLEHAPLAVNLTDGRRIMHYDYRIVGKESLDTEVGPLDTIRVQKIQEPDDKRGFEVWVAPAYHNLPVRIRYTEKDGTVFDSVLAKITYAEK
jgi:hypothetical protein